jgi:hypothetical protein
LQMKICVWPNKLVNGEIDDNMWSLHEGLPRLH